uniref:Uncharacterized protein n=1 Tax=Arundo donax TaxID=35708 RepID=A0A0A8Y2P3_ARUDO
MRVLFGKEMEVRVCQKNCSGDKMFQSWYRQVKMPSFCLLWNS